MYFYNYNDYELLYLINEGSEIALNLLLEKYKIISYPEIKKVYFGSRENMLDIQQDCVLIIYNCIKRYNMDSPVSFYSYTLISIKNYLYKIKDNKHSCYHQYHLANDSVLCEMSEPIRYNGKFYFKDELYIAYFDECIMSNMSNKFFGQKYNMTKNQVQYLRRLVIDKLNEFFVD